jgi:NAD(P)-dependent dehydrogenase (short-subunit alcohol dehydrogenase family)
VVFVSSGAAHRISGGRAVYSASKRAGEGFFETLAAEYEGDRRVRVAIVDPGIMDTGMQAQLRRHASRGGYLPGGDRFLRLAEQGLLPSPEEVARKITEEHFSGHAVP